MNTLIGKSSGIALLMAAALIAALFAMGVFSATGAGADSHITATVTASDENRDDDADTTDIDTLTISVMGLTRLNAHADNVVAITMTQDLGTAATVEGDWGGGKQYAQPIAAGDVTAVSTTGYSIALAENLLIEAGDATVTLELPTDNRIDSNTIITAITIGRGEADSNTLFTVAIPEEGLTVSGDIVETGPSITIDPMVEAVDAARADAHTITVTGMNFVDDVDTADVAITAATIAADGTATPLTVDSGSPVDADGDPDPIVDGAFEQEITFAAQTTAINIRIIATQDGDTAVTAMFYVNSAPTITTVFEDLTFAHDGAAQTVMLEGTDEELADRANLMFEAMSDMPSVADVEVSEDNTMLTVTRGRTAGTATISVTVSDGKSKSEASTFMVTVDAPPVESSVSLNTDKAGAATRVTVKARGSLLGTLRTGDEIAINLKSFGLPDSIDTSDVTIDDTENAANPRDVNISGDDVVLVLDKLDTSTSANNNSATNIIDASDPSITITIREKAGITTPTKAGMYPVKIDGRDDADADGYDIEYEDGADDTAGTADDVNPMTRVAIVRSISLDPKSGGSGKDVTVKGSGFTDGSATVFIDKESAVSNVRAYRGNNQYDSFDTVIATVDVTGGAFTLVTDKISKPSSPAGVNSVYVNAIDGNGDLVAMSAMYEFKPTISVSPESASPGEKVTVTVSDWTAGTVTMVRFGGSGGPKAAATVDADNSSKYTATVPSGLRTGKQKVEVETGSGIQTASATIEITNLELTVSPSEVVPGQQVTITDSGYADDKAVSSITIGGKTASTEDATPADNNTVLSSDTKSTSNGSVAATVYVPLNVGSGEKVVMLEVDGRTGKGMVTVAKPAITLDPDESVPGSIISVNGTGFASEGRVEVRYKGAIEEVGKADSSGSFHIRLEIPSDAGVDKSNPVKVEVRGQTSINATANHKTPGAAIMLPETVQVGSLVTISGTNFEVFSTLDISAGGKDATPTTAETDKNGAFELEIRVPRLTAGSHTVTVKDGEDNSVTETFNVTTTAVVSTPEEVFGVLGAKLVSVWSLDNATKAWSAYFPGAPEGVSDLTGVSRGDIVWINVNADVMFQGGMLTTGWNLISLE
ncbi:MAG: hypothetical protein F4X27_09520 [Chloroflexi bacterium]|nr:hypothetical protein [Chloroflexota bacterium]